MQVLNLNGSINTPGLNGTINTLGLNANINTLGQVLGVQNNYNDVVNKPQINGVTLVGNISSAILNIKTSDLTNDAGYLTNADIPTKTSDLINDSDFTTGAALTDAIASVSSEIPTATSELINDSGFLTSIDIPSVPTKTSDLVNDSGYITAATAPVTSVNGLTGDVVITASNADYDAGTTIKDKIDNVEAAIPTATSELNNDSGFVTGSDLPTNVSQLNNDIGYITAAGAPVQSVNSATGAVVLDASDIEYSAGVTVNSKIDSVEAAIPTDTNDLTNGANFITAAGAPVQSVNSATGAVVLDASDIEYSAGVTVNSKIDSVESVVNGKTDKSTVDTYNLSSSTPIIINPVGAYHIFLIIGFVQGVGTVNLLVKIFNSSINSIIDFVTGNTFSDANLTFGYNPNTRAFVIQTPQPNLSLLAIIHSGAL